VKLGESLLTNYIEDLDDLNNTIHIAVLSEQSYLVAVKTIGYKINLSISLNSTIIYLLTEIYIYIEGLVQNHCNF